MIDSGVLAGIPFHEPGRTSLLRMLAFHAGLPVTALYDDELGRLNNLLAVCFRLDPTNDFSNFCSRHCPQSDELVRLYARIVKHRLSPINHYPHPLFRLLKDHLPARLFEIYLYLSQYASLSEGEARDSPMFLGDPSFQAYFARTNWGLLVIGPVFVQESLNEGVARAYFRSMTDQMKAFLHNVDSFWAESANRPAYPPIYTPEHLTSLAFARSKQLHSIVSKRTKRLLRLHAKLASFNPDKCGLIASQSYMSKLVGGTAAAERRLQGSILIKGFGTSAIQDKLYFRFSRSGPNMISSPQPVHSDFANAYAEEMAKTYNSWSSWISESISQLRHWLMTNRTHSADGHSEPTNRAFGRRLARFLANVFEGFECTIYQAVYIEGRPRLQTYGAFSNDAEGVERLRNIAEHMELVASSHLQSQSIAYRCLISDEVQYCQYHDYETGQTIPAEQALAFPKDSKFRFWGHSACALPIRTNGILWGVLEITGRRPHAFPDFVRAKIEEVCGIIGSHLFRSDLVSSVYKISHAIANDELASAEKKTVIERTLAQMFGSKTYAIVRTEPFNRGEVDVFLEVGREDLVASANRGDDQEYFRPILDFSRGSAKSWSGVIGGQEFKDLFKGIARRKFYEGALGDFVYLAKISWDTSDGTALPGVAMLTFSHEMQDQDNWKEAVEFALKYVSTLTGSLYSSDVWEQKLREKIGHELSKTAGNLTDSVRRLRSIHRVGADSSLGGAAELISGEAEDQGLPPNRVVEAVVEDLGSHATALHRYVAILTTHRDITDFDDDPRLYLIREMKAKWRNDPARKPASLRKAYNSAFFGKLENFKDHDLQLPTLDSSLNWRIDMDELSLNEVLTTLVDNLLKYSKPGTALTVREDSTHNNRGFQISNVGLRLDDHEKLAIFKNAVRGIRAREKYPDQGSGYGLWFAYRTMHLWGGGLRHMQRPLSENEPDWTWHDFTLLFRNNMIRRRGGVPRNVS